MYHRLAQYPVILGLFAACLCATGIPAQAQVSLTGAGATFPAPLYGKWFDAFQHIGHAEINYQPNGSGGGIKGVTEGTVDFGASDKPLSDEQMEVYRQNHGFNVLLFPTVLGAAVPAYNVPGVSAELTFSPEVIAGIFLGQITTWNDERIARCNPNVSLPAAKIVVIHRSDGSGTTYCWTDYLSKVSPEWLHRVGRNTSVEWPVGLGGKGNDGIASLIRQQNGSIGYLELIYAVKNGLSYGKVVNRSGTAVKADLRSVTAAAASSQNLTSDFRLSITDAAGTNAYPIATFTWLLIPERNRNTEKQHALSNFLNWALTDGQNMVEALGYARLPTTLAENERKALVKLR